MRLRIVVVPKFRGSVQLRVQLLNERGRHFDALGCLTTTEQRAEALVALMQAGGRATGHTCEVVTDRRKAAA